MEFQDPYQFSNPDKRKSGPSLGIKPGHPIFPGSPFEIEPVNPVFPWSPSGTKSTRHTMINPAHGGYHSICQRCATVINNADGIGITVTSDQIKTGMDFICNGRNSSPHPAKYKTYTPANDFLLDGIDEEPAFMSHEEGYALLSNILDQNPKVTGEFLLDLYQINLRHQVKTEQEKANGITFIIDSISSKVRGGYIS
jgi:hypothetical protein